jgi:hypothetical protein
LTPLSTGSPGGRAIHCEDRELEDRSFTRSDYRLWEHAASRAFFAGNEISELD